MTKAPPIAKSHRDLMIGTQLTEKTKAWKMVTHPHTVIGERRGFQVRVYHDAEWPQPYFVALVDTAHSWVMDGAAVPTEAAAQAAAIALLAGVEGNEMPIGRA